MKDLEKRYGKWALITGASSGIGAEYARQLAASGLNTILVARRSDELHRLSEHLSRTYGVESIPLAADLTKMEDIRKIISATEDLQVGLLVNNAGKEDSGHFLQIPIETSIDTLELNCKAPLILTHHFAQGMAKRNKGGIIFMSSIVAFQGVPLISNYTATKAYDLILGESLAAELKPYGIDVLSSAPGFTATDLSPDFNFEGIPIKPMHPSAVVSSALRSLGKSRLNVPGFINRFLYYTGKIQPRSFNSLSFGMVFKKVLRSKI